MNASFALFVEQFQKRFPIVRESDGFVFSVVVFSLSEKAVCQENNFVQADEAARDGGRGGVFAPETGFCCEV